ncbi:MAG: hypothetical protein LBS96_04875, partial [Oscillospiraceae bacterium]|nr:hypothetical protein [Oscillospiraceae bacterium]
MHGAKMRRGLSGFLAALMVFSVLSTGLAAVVSAKDWGYPGTDGTDGWAISRKITEAPKTRFTVPDRIMVADANGYTFGTNVIPQDNVFTFQLTSEDQGFTIVPNSVKIVASNVSNDHLLDLKIRQHTTVGDVYSFGLGEGGIATAGDVVRLNLTYKTQDKSGVQRSWTVSNYCYTDNRRGEAFTSMMVNKASYYSTSEHWCDTVLWLPNTLGELTNIPSMAYMSGGTDAHGAFSYGFMTNGLKNYTDPQTHEYCSLWGMNSGDALQYDRMFVGDGIFPGFVMRVVEKWASNSWTVGNGSDDLPAIRNVLDNYIPKGHVYFDQDPSITNTPIQLGAATSGKSGSDSQYNGSNCPVSFSTLAGGGNATLGNFGGFSGGNTGLGTFGAIGGPTQVNGSQTTFRIERKHAMKWTGFWQTSELVTFTEKLDLVVHFYNKQYLRKVVQDIQALNLQEIWMLDTERGGYDDELGQLNEAGTANANYTPWSEFEDAYAKAVAMLNRSDVLTDDGDPAGMQREIDLATANLLNKIQEAAGDPLRVATPTGFAAQYGSSVSVGGTYTRTPAKLLLKPADYGGVDIYLLGLPAEYYYKDADGNLINYKYWSDEDFERLDKAVQDVYLDRPLDVRYQRVIADQRARLKAALFPNGQALQFREYDVSFESYEGALWPNSSPLKVRVYEEIKKPATDPVRT